MSGAAVEKARPAPGGLKRSRASLIGGVACGGAVFILYLLLAGAPSALNVGIGAVIGLALGAWVRLADL